MPAIGLMGLEDLHHLLLDRIIPLHLPKFQSVDRFVVPYAVIHAAKGRTALREKKSLQLHHADHHRSRATRPGSTLEGSLCKMFGLQPAIEVSIPPRNRPQALETRQRSNDYVNEQHGIEDPSNALLRLPPCSQEFGAWNNH